MKDNKSYILYKLIFPNLGYYIGSTCQVLKKRIISHKSKLRQNIHPNPTLQEWYNKGGDLDSLIWEEIKEGDKYQIRKEEWKHVKLEDEKCLNIQKPYHPKYLQTLIKKGNKKTFKVYDREKQRKKYKTPLGRATYMLNSAQQNIKKFSEQKRWDMVERWKEIVEKRKIVKNILY